MPFNIFNAPVENLVSDLFQQKKVSVSVLRLDKIHPVVSGNKLFKLHYFLEQAVVSKHKTILTFGGAYSNHLVATAFACREYGLNSIGIVRGEEPVQPSSSLQQCNSYGMQLKFTSREKYNEKENDLFSNELYAEFGDSIIIPEGGYHPLGAKGAALIAELVKDEYTHTCTATGTATTLAGLFIAFGDKKIISVPVLKGMTDIKERIGFLCGNNIKTDSLEIFNNYHFGGYAKKTTALVEFMNQLWQQHQIPSDFVYTAKLFFAVFDQIKNNYFAEGARILCLHTGGLQGNDSLPAGSLLF